LTQDSKSILNISDVSEAENKSAKNIEQVNYQMATPMTRFSDHDKNAVEGYLC
jgi:hypothetical protein